MSKCKIYIAADHGGYALKAKIHAFLKEQGFDAQDLGTNSDKPCDYADYAHILAAKCVNLANFKDKIDENNEKMVNLSQKSDENSEKMANLSQKNLANSGNKVNLAQKSDENIEKMGFGILICGSGIGVSIAANRHKGVRCALCHEPLSAVLARKHNDANVLALGARLVGEVMAFEIVKSFLNTEFEGGRHIKRIEKIEKFEVGK